ncbi:hypothetical protein CRG98_026480 [Punica granatum]|uniref:Uncharacterized protein n=1 Tax=Punica granatum TaxID=22663 RepID=A0A2I0JA44_PUNGR|nr:hypothetical protein CRG98_026480 [Punica granatum]
MPNHVNQPEGKVFSPPHSLLSPAKKYNAKDKRRPRRVIKQWGSSQPIGFAWETAYKRRPNLNSISPRICPSFLTRPVDLGISPAFRDRRASLPSAEDQRKKSAKIRSEPETLVELPNHVNQLDRNKRVGRLNTSALHGKLRTKEGRTLTAYPLAYAPASLFDPSTSGYLRPFAIEEPASPQLKIRSGMTTT